VSEASIALLAFRLPRETMAMMMTTMMAESLGERGWLMADGWVMQPRR